MSFLSALADVIEKLADEAERAPAAAPAPKTAAPHVAPSASPTKVAADAVRDITGKDASDALVNKLAAEPELMEIVTKVAAEKNKPTPLGGPSEEKVAYPTTDRRERIANAFESWGSAIVRNS
jgi:hypothetical protein